MKQVNTSPLPKWSYTITLGTNATGGATLVTTVDGITSTYVTILSETADTAAANWGAQLATDLGSGYDINVSTVFITIATTSMLQLDPVSTYSTDASQTAVQSGYNVDTALLDNVSVAGTGKPVGVQAGFACGANDRDTPKFIKVRLLNAAGSAKSARFQVWFHTEELGWAVDDTIGVRTVSNAGGAVTYTDLILGIQNYSNRIAIECLGDATGVDLANCTMSAWATVL